MWKCHKCGKPVYFAERKQSLGYDWHPECLRCEECGKRLNPGQHAEHKGVPYCHVPCYGALFGPQLFGHGTRVESHKSFGVKGAPRPTNAGPPLPRDHIESKLKAFNAYYDNKSLEIRSREVNNRLILEGALRVYWGVHGVIHLKEDDDQRTLVVRKRMSKAAADESSSDKENEISDSLDPPTTTSEVEGQSTDISLSESMTFDSCSLNEYPVSELPTTPEDRSANTTGTQSSALAANGCETTNTNTTTVDDGDTTESSSTLCASGSPARDKAAEHRLASATLPSKLEAKEWDEIDELLQVERRVSEKDHIYETMPSKLPSSSSSSSSSSTATSTATSSQSSPTKTISTQNLTDTTNLTTPSTPTSVNQNSTSTSAVTTTSNNNSRRSSSSTTTTTTSSDNFITATDSLTTASKDTTTTTTTTCDNYETSDEATLKPMDYEEFQRSVHQDYVNGANSFQEPGDDTLKRNQPIDPSRIHDSLKLYGDNPMSKSFNCEQALRSFDSGLLKDTLTMKSGGGGDSPRRLYSLQKSGSASSNGPKANGQAVAPAPINRSKSGPSCFDYSDSDDDATTTTGTLKAPRPSTMRRSDVPPRFISINMNCYPPKQRGDTSSRSDGNSGATNSGAVGGDELTQTEEMVTANGDDPPLHITEDGVVLRRPPRTGASAIKRRSGNRRSRTKLKRRCSINGHFYNRETSIFTPPYGSQMSVWVTSLVTTQEVINLVLEKYKVDMQPENFSLFIIRDNGEQKRLKDTDYPLVTRVMLGPHEDVARLFLVDAKKTDEISNEVAQFINLSLPECRAILDRYDQELQREIAKVKDKYAELRRRIISRMESLKVHL